MRFEAGSKKGCQKDAVQRYGVLFYVFSPFGMVFFHFVHCCGAFGSAETAAVSKRLSKELIEVDICRLVYCK